jgi:hypothetical protein
MTLRRVFACLAALLLVGGVVRPTLAASWRSYRSPTYRCSLSYPPDWQQFHPKGVNFAISTADTGAIFDLAIEPEMPAANAAFLRAVLASALSASGVVKSTPIHYATITLHSVPFSVGDAKITRSNGQAITFTVYVTVRAHTLYVFETALLTAINGIPRQAAIGQGRALTRIVQSVTITAPATP